MSICLSFLWLSCHLIWIFVGEPNSLSVHRDARAMARAVVCPVCLIVCIKLHQTFVSFEILGQLWTLWASWGFVYGLFLLWPPGDPRRKPERRSNLSTLFLQPEFYLIKPSAAPVAPIMDKDSCMLYRFHAIPAHPTNTHTHTLQRPLRMTNIGPNLFLWNIASNVSTRQTHHIARSRSEGISFSTLWLGPSSYMKVCDLTLLPWAHEGTGAREIKVRGVSEVWKEMQRNPCAADCRLPLYGARAAGELRQPPVRSPQGIRYPQLDNDI